MQTDECIVKSMQRLKLHGLRHFEVNTGENLELCMGPLCVDVCN